MKLLVIGHARHGKDSVANILTQEFGLRATSSSLRAAEIFLFDKLRAKYGYQSPSECYADRVNKRAEWHDEIARYNTPDATRLARGILATSDIYVGMRSDREIEACIDQRLFNSIIWVDASKRLPLEPPESFGITEDVADRFIDNNGPEMALRRKTIECFQDIIAEEFFGIKMESADCY